MLSIPTIMGHVIMNQTVLLNSTDGNSSFTANINETTSINITIDSDEIIFQNLNYTNSELGVGIIHEVRINNTIGHTNTSSFPFLENSTNITKLVGFLLNMSVNATLEFNTATECLNISKLRYESTAGIIQTINNTNITCVGTTRARAFFPEIGNSTPSNFNTITVVYDLISDWRDALIIGLLGISLLIFYVGSNLNQDFEPLKKLLYLSSVLLSVTLIFALHILDSGASSSTINTTETFYKITATVFVFLTFFVMLNTAVKAIEIIREKKP